MSKRGMAVDNMVTAVETPLTTTLGEKNIPVSRPNSGEEQASKKNWLGSQTLLRGLDALEAVAGGATILSELAAALKVNRRTAQRLAACLVERRYLVFAPRSGYRLGPKSLEMGYQAKAQIDILRVARDHLEKLAAFSRDTVHLGILDGTRALYLDKIPGNRPVEISSRVGELKPLCSSGLGKALLLDDSESRLREYYRCENEIDQRCEVSENAWIRCMQDYAKIGNTFDLEENEDLIRSVSAPIRDATGRIKAAISVSSAAQYMNDERMQVLAKEVYSTAVLISRELGWGGAITRTPNCVRVDGLP